MGQGFRLGGSLRPIRHPAIGEFTRVLAQQDVRGEAEQAFLHVAFETRVNGHHHHQNQDAQHDPDQRDQAERGQHGSAGVEIAPGEEEAEGATFDAVR